MAEIFTILFSGIFRSNITDSPNKRLVMPLQQLYSARHRDTDPPEAGARDDLDLVAASSATRSVGGSKRVGDSAPVTGPALARWSKLRGNLVPSAVLQSSLMSEHFRG